MGINFSRKLVSKHISDKDRPISECTLPRNSISDTIVKKDKKGVSNLYHHLNGRKCNIIEDVGDRWNSHESISSNNNQVSKSFNSHSTLIDDTYATYEQFITLHQRFFTNEKPTKMRIKQNPLCNMFN